MQTIGYEVRKRAQHSWCTARYAKACSALMEHGQVGVIMHGSSCHIVMSTRHISLLDERCEQKLLRLVHQETPEGCWVVLQG